MFLQTLLRKSNLVALCILAVGCNSLPIDQSAFASSAKVKTVVLGGCFRPFEIGWSSCQIEEGGVLPKMQILFMNPGNYAVGDCNMGVLATGSVQAPGIVEIDLAPLTSVATERGFCFVKVDVEERWGDNNSRRVPMAGGFMIEVYERGYLPTPPRVDLAWCYKVARTTSGRTVMEKCPQ